MTDEERRYFEKRVADLIDSNSTKLLENRKQRDRIRELEIQVSALLKAMVDREIRETS
jgi:hypothetical protein